LKGRLEYELDTNWSLRECFAELCGRLIDGQTNKSRCACVVTLIPALQIMPLIAINLYLASCGHVEISAVPPNPFGKSANTGLKSFCANDRASRASESM
jgi:hypothetical protein